MRFKIYIFLLFILLLIISRVEASENKVTVVYQGIFQELNGVISEGVTFIDYGELRKFINNDLISNNFIPEKINEQKIALRDWAESSGFRVLWEGKTNSILLINSNSPSSNVATSEDFQLISKICSMNWLKARSKDDLFNYFSQFLSLELSKKFTEKGWTFIEGLTDWHWTYDLKEIEVLDSGEDWKVLLATIGEENYAGESETGFGLFAIRKKPSQKWVITDLKFNWIID